MENILTSEDDKPKEVAELYSQKIRSLFPDVNENSLGSEPENDYHEITFKNHKGGFNIWYDKYGVGIDVIGADAGYWNTSENDNIDIYFWFGVGVLRNGIRYRKPFIGLHQAWIYSDENKKWAVVPKKYHAYGYTKIVDKLSGEKKFSS